MDKFLYCSTAGSCSWGTFCNSIFYQNFPSTYLTVLTIIIKVVLPFSVYVSLMFSMFYFLTDINFGLSPLGFVYINGFVTVTIYLPCAINPIVAIAIFNPYRQAFLALLKNASGFKTDHPKITNK